MSQARQNEERPAGNSEYVPPAIVAIGAVEESTLATGGSKGDAGGKKV